MQRSVGFCCDLLFMYINILLAKVIQRPPLLPWGSFHVDRTNTVY